MIIINFSGHPLTERQKATIESIRHQTISQLYEPILHFSQTKGFDEQIDRYLNELNLPPETWQKRLLIVPPGLAPATAVLLAKLHGRLGHFPMLIRIRPDHGGVEPYAVAEIVHLQELRDASRLRR